MSAFILDSFQVHIYDPWLLCFLVLPLLFLPLFCMVLLFLWSEGKVLVTQLYLTFCDPMDYSSPGSMGFSKIPFSTGFLRPKDRTQVSCIAGRFLTVWATRDAPQSKTNRSLAAGHHSFPNFIHYPELRTRAVTITWWTFSCFNTGNRDSSVFVLFQPKYRWQNMQAVKTYTVFKDIYKW